MNDSLVTFQNSEGLALRGTLCRLTRSRAVFETYGPDPVLRMSELLNNFTLLHLGRPVYSGKAVISNLIQTGACTMCEALLESGWVDEAMHLPARTRTEVCASFERFVQQHSKAHRISPEFKAVIADIQMFLLDLRSWLEQTELIIRSDPQRNRAPLERELMENLTPRTSAAIGTLFDRFEIVACGVEPEVVAVHQVFARRQLHPLILESPFVFRTFQKPLGYAGDYEVVNMMMRDPYEGASLFAKAFNVCALGRPPIVGHRNRIGYLTEKLVQEAARVSSQGRPLRVISFGSGPAHELQRLLNEQHCPRDSEFTLVDFDAETLEHCGRVLTECNRKNGSPAHLNLVKRSVQQVLKQSAKASSVLQNNGGFDLAYCAGLYDYLPDQVCFSLTGYFYDLLRPGGQLLVTNVDNHGSRHEMEYFLDWHLIYRDTSKMLRLIPPRIPRESIRTVREPTGINVFLEVRKPANE